MEDPGIFEGYRIISPFSPTSNTVCP